LELSAALKIVKRARLGDVDFVFRRKNLDRNFNPDGFIQGKNIFNLHFLIKILKLNRTRLTDSSIYNRSHCSRFNKEQHAFERIG